MGRNPIESTHCFGNLPRCWRWWSITTAGCCCGNNQTHPLTFWSVKLIPSPLVYCVDQFHAFMLYPLSISIFLLIINNWQLIKVKFNYDYHTSFSFRYSFYGLHFNYWLSSSASCVYIYYISNDTLEIVAIYLFFQLKSSPHSSAVIFLICFSAITRRSTSYQSNIMIWVNRHTVNFEIQHWFCEALLQ